MGWGVILKTTTSESQRDTRIDPLQIDVNYCGYDVYHLPQLMAICYENVW